MKLTLARSAVLLAALAMAACAMDAPAMNAPDDVAAINALVQKYQTAFNAGDVATIGTIYTADAMSMPNHQPVAKGRDAIVAALTAQMQAMAGQVELTTDEVKTSGDFGFVRGTFKITLTPKEAGAAPISDEGSFVVTFHKDAGTWLATMDMDNSSMPMPGMDDKKMMDMKKGGK